MQAMQNESGDKNLDGAAKFDSDEALCSEVAKYLDAGMVVGWFQGRLEFGLYRAHAVLTLPAVEGGAVVFHAERDTHAGQCCPQAGGMPIDGASRAEARPGAPVGTVNPAADPTTSGLRPSGRRHRR